jgi:hypothetical protein
VQGCISDQAIDAAMLGGPKVGVVSTITSVTPAAPFLFRSYELPREVAQLSEGIAACEGSSRFEIWQVRVILQLQAVAPCRDSDWLNLARCRDPLWPTAI